MRVLTILFLVASMTCAADPPPQGDLQRLIAAWSDLRQQPPAIRAAATPPALDITPLSRAEAEVWRTALLAAWDDHLRAQQGHPDAVAGFPAWKAWPDIQRLVVRGSWYGHFDAVGVLQREPLTLRAGVRRLGEQPVSGWPVYL
jgi:hypothetical protein